MAGLSPETSGSLGPRFSHFGCYAGLRDGARLALNELANLSAASTRGSGRPDACFHAIREGRSAAKAGPPPIAALSPKRSSLRADREHECDRQFSALGSDHQGGVVVDRSCRIVNSSLALELRPVLA